MPVLPKRIRDRVIPIGHPVEGHDPHCHGTAFLYGVRPAPGDDYRVLGVTNRHNLKDLNSLIFKVNPAGGGLSQQFTIPLKQGNAPTWTPHPQALGALDIAVFDPDFPDGFECEYFRDDLDTAPVERLNGLDISEGDPVFALGYTLDMGLSQNAPVVRSGCVAEISDARAVVSPAFFTDIMATSGTSGGPVVLHSNWAGLDEELEPLLLGIVHSFKAILIECDKPQAYFSFKYELNSGLARAFTVDCIRQTVTQFLQDFP